MTVPAPLIEFFQQEAAEYLERLDQLLVSADHGPPDATSFVAQARALRGSAMMTRLDGLTELAATVERIANGLRAGELRWDQRLLFAVRGALAELRALVALTSRWTENEQRRSRTQSVALAAVAAGYMMSGALSSMSPASAVVPVSRLLMDDGASAVVYRNPQPAITIAQRFRGDIAAAADGVAREAMALAASTPGSAQLAAGDGVRRALLGLADAADSYGATSIATLATRMARVGLEQTQTRAAIQAVARLLMDRELTDQQLAAQVRGAAAAWNTMHGTPAQVGGGSSAAPVYAVPAAQATPGANAAPIAQATPTANKAPASHATPTANAAPIAQSTPTANTPYHAATTPIVPVESLVFRGPAALLEAQRVRDRLTKSITRDNVTIEEVRELVGELSDLLDLAAT